MTNKTQITYTAEQMKQISVAYLCFGNSAEDLALQLIQALQKGTNQPVEVAVHDFFDDIVMEMEEGRKDSPESFETTTEEELQQLLDIYEEHKYEANSLLWG